jgi:hypothetical protein
MIPKSGYRFSEKIVLKEQAKAKRRINPNHFALASNEPSTKGVQGALVPGAAQHEVVRCRTGIFTPAGV